MHFAVRSIQDICFMCITECYAASAYIEVEKEWLDTNGARLTRREDIPILKDGRVYNLDGSIWNPYNNGWRSNLSHIIAGRPDAFVRLAIQLGPDCYWSFNNCYGYEPFNVSSLFGMPVCALHSYPAIRLWEGKRSNVKGAIW